MAKTKDTQSKKPKPPAGAKAPRRPPAAPEGRPAAASQPRPRDPRLPPPGTTIAKRDRHGATRCECAIEDAGVRYKGKLYRSLSAAALAAAKDLGTPLRAVNGFVWWGLSKPARRGADPFAALGRAWERYRERAASIASALTDDNRDQARDALEKHADALAGLQKRLA